LASTIKIDVLALDAERVATYAEQFKAAGLTILAEKVETHDQHQQMLDLGFDLFQGYHYAKPKVLARDRIPDDHMADPASARRRERSLGFDGRLGGIGRPVME
jgi:EAL and modified HD-GYP domain-containing signal transduction protein